MPHIFYRPLMSGTVCVTLCFVLVFQLTPSVADAQADNPDQPYAIAARASVDENLFALRLLADIYAHWPDLKGDRSNLRKWFAGARTSTAEMQGRIRSRRLDPDLDSLFRDCLDYMAATETYLASLDLIEDQNSTKSIFDALTSAWDAYQTGSGAASTAGKMGFSDGHAASAGKLIGAADFAANLAARSRARNATTQLAISEQARKLSDRWQSTWANLQVTAKRMTTTYGWAVGEGGFDGFQSPQISDMINRCPRDPFLRVRYADAIINRANSPSECITAVNAYLNAATLVPADTAYDSLRLQYVEEAMESGVTASSIEAGNRGYVSHPSTAPSALKLARTYLAMDAQDGSGIGHVYLARALGFSGRYDEAASSATTALNRRKEWGDDPGFDFRYAKLMSLTNNVNLVPGWIRQAYSNGFTDIASFRIDPDFSQFRAQEPQLFKQLTTPLWTWSIKFGFVLDDVIIKNNSPFDLTNVNVKVHVRKDTKRWDPVVTCGVIKAGATCIGDSVMSITGDSYDEAAADLSADQM